MNNREEALLREYIRNNLRDDKLLNEGAKDLLKKALETGLSKLEDLTNNLKRLTPASDQIVDILEKNGAKDAVSKIDTMGQEFESAINSASDAVPSKKSESNSRKFIRHQRNKKPTVLDLRRSHTALNEVALGGFEAIGLILAAVGGVPLVLKGAYKLAEWLGAKGVSEKLKIAYKSAHHFEEKFIDVIIPDRAMYAVYMAFEEKNNPDAVANLKLYQDDPSSKLDGKRSMTVEEFKKSDLRKKYEKRVYALILLPWLISGLTSLEHMFHGFMGILHGGATGVKAIEVQAAAADVAPVIASELGTALSSLTKLSRVAATV